MGITRKLADLKDALTGDLSLGDNVKAKFGAGNDLQIYHDGTHSHIKDAGTGSLFLQSSNTIFIQNANGSANYFKGTDGGASELFHNGSAKLATTSTGIDVTGTANITTVDLGNWTITESAGVLYFKSLGVNKMKLDASGNLTVTGNVTAYGTV